MKVDACFEDIKIRWIWMAPAGKGKWLSRGFANFLFADQPGVVNPLFATNVYDLVGILRECPGPATEVTCSRLQ